jgi:hypothetical protein
MAEAIWYPLCKVRFQLRIEDFANDAPIPSKAISPETGSEAFGLGLEHVKSAANAVLDLFGVPNPAQVNSGYQSVGYDIVPFSVSVERNSYRQADECRIQIPLAKMPFDPRLIRAATVQVFGGVVGAKEWGDAQARGADGIMIPDDQQNGHSNELFRGFVDDWEMTLAQGNTLQVTARDLTSFFVDAELPRNALNDIPKATRLDDVVRLLVLGDQLPSLISRRPGLPGVRGLEVVNDTGGSLPQLDEIKPPNWFDSKKTVKKGRKRAKQDTQRMSYWDMITDLCVSAGFICYIKSGKSTIVTPQDQGASIAAKLVISDPRTYYGQSTTSGKTIVPVSTVRTFLYGLNVEGLKIRRKFGGTKVPTIEVRSFDERTGTGLTGRFPISPKNNKPSTSGSGDREEVSVFILRDISGEGAQATVDRAARSIYEQLSRGELEVSFRTMVLAALPQNVNPETIRATGTDQLPSSDPDMFRLQSGDPVIVEVDKAVVEEGRMSEYTAFTRLSPESQKEAMIAAGLRPDLADQIAQAGTSQFVQKEFRLQKMVMSWDSSGKWVFELKTINFLDVRSAVENSE